jgi:lipoprotein-anchoring transpeptidase ErfK/SrfK
MRHDETETTTSEHPGYGGVRPEPEKTGRTRWLLIAAVVFVLLLVGGAFAAYAYDDSRRDEIANGVTIGGVDVGGLDSARAKELLQNQLVEPLQRSLRVRFRGHSYKLAAKRLRIHADLDGAIDKALAASREGGLPGRLYRYVTGGKVDEQIAPRITYFEPAINRFVRGVADDIDREPVNASVNPSPASLNVVAAKPGRKLRDNLLTRQLNAAVEKAEARRTIVAQVHRTKPEVSSDEVAAEYPSYLTLDRYAFTLRLWKNLKLVKSYTVAVGQAGLETPAGLYHIQDKQVDPSWHVPNSAWAGSLAGQVIPPGPADPLKARWMGIFGGAGIHGTDETYSLGTAVSHGCVRMSIPDVIELYDQVDVGTPIYIG